MRRGRGAVTSQGKAKHDIITSYIRTYLFIFPNVINLCIDFIDCFINCSFVAVNCGIGQFACDGRCVPLKWKCDGEPDCADGSDELSFCARCGSDEFRCHSGRCLPKIYLCDGTADCGSSGVDDDSDEDPSICERFAELIDIYVSHCLVA
ncbi:Low-density lipoprotein receptor domain class A [Oesophagostomum dentatum]|uniref:Low-density lipoprotein receptor domain class A n=1 Tax=Oesophagostomum dentatum TaxID=61180 RepID=A0A0B1SUI4_OESDE|nr:Low-density lipoprotein receptor domain class A [Oesophagostomum dentatum]